MAGTAGIVTGRQGIRLASGESTDRGGETSGLLARIGAIVIAWESETGSSITLPDLRGGIVLDAAEAVAELTDRTMSRLAGESSEDARGRLTRILGELQRVSFDLQLHAMNVLSVRLSGASRALATLRAGNGIGDPLERVCAELVRQCGFGRAVLSRVSGAVWKPWIADSTAKDELAKWFPGWVGSAIAIDVRAPEHQLLTTRQPVLVLDTEAAPVHRPIIVDSGHSRSYVVAPLVSRGAVVGFLHADHLMPGARVTEADRDVLWAFASGVGFLSERSALQEALRQQRQQTRDILIDAAESIMAFTELSAAGDAAHAPLDAVRVIGERTGLDELTRREAEVLRLMADGLTNAAIADRLVIAPDTIKSHVKHILRKLGTSNRSQAVARYLSA
ncbi:LuxR C-terminal-related transcriptional regulator [Arthrobacter ramosus]|uniref:LuxR C-terminal-related transcriptional regulator n=1 Tax=Arthrobacter ramosus TaxID=1672 RepID=A0ABV5Y4L1_ARTRM|nr:LuxR C-terminal-related transcriptional regulator [Arthrobacter ramosus]